MALVLALGVVGHAGVERAQLEAMGSRGCSATRNGAPLNRAMSRRLLGVVEVEDMGEARSPQAPEEARPRQGPLRQRQRLVHVRVFRERISR